MIKFYIFLSKMFEAGYSKVLWRINSVIQILLILNTFLILKGFDFGLFEYILMALTIILIIFGSGFIYLKLGLFKADQRAIFSENEIIVSMEKDLKEIKKLLKK